MPTFEASIAISASADGVWRTLSDVTRWPEWLPTVTKVEPLGGQNLRIGARFVVHQPKLRPVTWVVTELADGCRFVWVAHSPGLVMVAEHTVTGQPSGTSTATLRFSFNGILGGIIGRVFRQVTESYLAQEAASLRQRVEGLR